MKGKLIILDGIDGSGITTQAKLLTKILKNKGINVLLTKEPSNKDIVRFINKSKDPLIDFFYFLIDRSLNYKKINDYLKRGFVVICDRSFPSTLVYQYYSSDLKNYLQEELVFYLNHLAMNHLKPTLVIIFNVDIKESLKRLKRKKKKSLIKKFEKSRFLEKARKGFIYFAKKYNWVIIDANKSINEVFNEVYKLVSKNL